MNSVEIRYSSGNGTSVTRLEADKLTTGGNNSDVIYVHKRDEIVGIFSRENIIGVYKES